MNWFTGVVLYALIWWTVLFAVLPFGTRPEPEADALSQSFFDAFSFSFAR